MTHPNDNDSPVVPLSRFRTALGRSSGARQVDALISAADPHAAVAALSVPELYYLIKDVGFADTAELIALATPEQIRGCVDMDVWDRDRVTDLAVRPWLAALIDAGYETLTAAWQAMDSELTGLLLRRWTRIYDHNLDEAPPENSALFVLQTPDTFFSVEIVGDDDDHIRLVAQLIEYLYRGDQELARHTLMAARSESEAHLEEESYRWRSGRMADLGYVDFYEALEVFRPLDPTLIKIGEGSMDTPRPPEPGDEARVPRNLPVPFAQAIADQSFLARCLQHIVDAKQAADVEVAIIYLLNRVLSASQASPGDAEAIKVGAEHAAATLSVGLEMVAEGDPQRGAEALRTVSLTRLHRAGFSVTLQLRRLAQALAPRLACAGDSDRAVMGALLGARPWYSQRLDDPPRPGIRPFRSVIDVRRVAEASTRLALRIAIAEQALGVDLVRATTLPEPRPELDDYIRTALAHALAGRPPQAAPLRRFELPTDFGSEPRASAKAALIAALDRAGVTAGREHLPALIAAWLDDLEQLCGGLDPAQAADSRFLAGVLLRND
jgi:hypothetical protein